jgi:hypothetical protein
LPFAAQKQKVKPEKGIQGNTLQREIIDLNVEIDLLLDENTTVFEARSTDKGRPYNSNIREIYYYFCFLDRQCKY